MTRSRRAMTAWFGVAGVALLALLAVCRDFNQQSIQAAAYVTHTHAVMGALGEAEGQLFRVEASQRGYLVALDPRFIEQREAATAMLRSRLQQAAELTADNPHQQQRVAQLQAMIDERIRMLRETQSLLQAGGRMSAEQRLGEGSQARTLAREAFSELLEAERSLLSQRQAVEAERARVAELTFGALGLGLLVLLPLAAWRLATDARAREAAEAATRRERRYDDLHAQALVLYNAADDRQAVLDGTLALLADSGHFPASAMYVHEELGGSLQLAASRAAPADTRPIVRMDDGPIGAAAQTRQPVLIEGFDPASGLVIDGGLLRLQPAAMLFCPILHQGQLLGVLVLAAVSRLSERERAFVDRIAAQLGVALHNLRQLAGLDRLAAELRARSADVERKNDELQHATRMKSEFIANMSHELRTPLNAIIGFSEILRDGMIGPMPDEQRDFVTSVHSSGKHLLSLINDVLDLSKVEAGQMSLDLTPEVPAAIAAGSVLIVRHQASMRGVQLSDDSDTGTHRLLLDARKTKQIISNLLANAVKFTPAHGSVRLRLRRVDTESMAVRPAGESTRYFPPPDLSPEQWLEIEVRDTGIGIAPEGLRQLFQPFVQIDSSLTREYEGTGLGLTMVQRLTALHGGGLLAHSIAGQGSTFTVWLPWREAVAPSAMAAAAGPDLSALLPRALPHAAPDGQAPCVLVIDDDPQSAELLRAQLQAHGYRVEIALDAQRGLQRAGQLQPQAIMLDVLMPEMDGWETLARLKDHESTRNIPVVIVSVTDEMRRGFALGAAQVLMKPVSKDDLLAALAAVGLEPSGLNGRVLVVDDDPMAVGIVSRQLASAGFDCVAAFGGQEALESVRRQRPALIVLDLMMPHVSGFDVIETLSHHPGSADIPIIVLTAKLVTAKDRELLRGRVQRLIEKSDFEIASLMAEVKRAVARGPVGSHETAA